MTLTPCLLLPDGRWLDLSGRITHKPYGAEIRELKDEHRPAWEAIARLGGHDLDRLLQSNEKNPPEQRPSPSQKPRKGDER